MKGVLKKYPEEYELYDEMCEECFEETHYDFNGNPREDYWNY